jgi:protoporphyrinogen oxidase
MGLSRTEIGIAILGAGPTGLGAAWRLANSGPESPNQPAFALFDGSDNPGGCAASQKTPQGFTFDFGGHVLFPHVEYPIFINLLNELLSTWHESVPARCVWIDGRLIPTPIQRNIHRLPVSQFAACLWDLWRHKRYQKKRSTDNWDEESANLLERLLRDFGPNLSRYVMIPLNKKMWAHEPEDLCSNWANYRSGSNERNIPQIFIASLIRNFIVRRDEPRWTKNTRVRYPLDGGTGAIWKALYDRLPASSCHLGIRIVGVDAKNKTLFLSDGSSIRYGRLITSIPIDVLLKLLIDEPELSSEASRFKLSATQIYGFGIQGRIPKRFEGLHGFIVPAENIPFWRVNFPSNFSPGNVPDPINTWSVQCETSIHSNAGGNAPSMEEIKRWLKNINVLESDEQIISIWSCYLSHGYPVPFYGRDELLQRVQSRLESVDIYSRGRFGGWKYEVSNQDYAFMQGVEIVDRLLHAVPEITYV